VEPILTGWVVTARLPPLRMTRLPSNWRVVDVPALSVTVSTARYVPALTYVWVVVGVVTVAFVPSPKSQA
jgi:hypothetical protein